jgi:ribonuclease III
LTETDGEQGGAPDQQLNGLQALLGITFSDATRLRRALVHSSYLNENPDYESGDNERLEFLGDAIVDLLAAEYLYQRFPDSPEGDLTALRASLVRTPTLARFAAQFDLGRYLWLGRGEEKSGGRTRPGLLADAFEAVVAALYLDKGPEAPRRLLWPLLESETNALVADDQARNAKGRLQEWAQGALQSTPSYRTVEASGPDHARLFTVEVMVAGQVLARGQGHSKQAAEEAAARAALTDKGVT